ncbi:MAG TPA: hypothetical protein PLP08_08715 [Plasticicumulans sp.]|uniref:translation initiation factor eIF-2B n=1 Tax=Plasticicumulans sp. TaxID=2307179 RepID=UPI002BD647F7|nr:hypothetical protein [Plasticicumulans sp.]HMV40534.1 hypothetical protein [Plasticicumulans sp.]HMW29212.1 hypothetical protein [Plasticicumulans sp.]HMW41144.1 hypothetical protein [Plasticicumulans sp.]HNF65343.1 hypothetical protein [Plasticicumulans sp.]HNG49663.1 hypothetical protein [Plasticicumulans sp.]
MPAELETLIRQLREDRAAGAIELARQALAGLGAYAERVPARSVPGLRASLAEAAMQVTASRPAVTPLMTLVNDWHGRIERVEAGTLQALRAHAVVSAARLSEHSRSAGASTAANVAAWIGPGRTVLTHGWSTTVLACLAQIAALGGLRVICTEARPLNEGRQLAARAAGLGVPVTLITDAQLALAATAADVVLVGADTVLVDGAVVGKAGTWPMALAARAVDIPFVVAAESCRRSPELSVSLEDQDPAEVGAPLPGVMLRNRRFDVTPPDLVTAWIDEHGVWTGEAA